MSRSAHDPAEARARNRYVVLNALRFGGLGLVLLGIAIARGLIGWPWWTGAVLAVIGVLDFYFLPRFLARAWKAGDAREK
ncbi:MAG: hypothetical protein GC147_05525 [Porphyrobacter sp.]|nr:hypothetical protein [Porphyrobacter sp.]